MTRQPTPPRPVTPLRHGLATAGLIVLLLALGASQAEAQLNQTLHQDGWLLAAVRSEGEHGSLWRTDVWFSFSSRYGGSVQLYFCEAMKDNTQARAYTLQTEPDHKMIYVEDVVNHFLDVGSDDWLGAIHYVADPNVQAYARVYSVSADGSSSYGQIIEGIPTSDMSPGFTSPDYTGTDEDQWIFPIKHTADNRYRVNVGAVNPTPIATRIHISIFDQGASPPGDSYLSFDLPPYSMRQLSDPFALVNGGEWSDYTIRVEAEDDGSGAFAYASVVDNSTNDAYFVRGVKRLAPTD